jgi:3-hydroxyisobutyrate dehydrogenase
MSSQPTVTVLGAGALGAAMAARLGETGHDVRLWNRTPERARNAAEATTGVTAVPTVEEAVAGSSAVLTVLRDGDAVAGVMAGALGAMDDGAVWIQASTVGPDHARSLADLARQHGVGYLDAPVSGSTAPARQGTLVWLVAGAEDVLASVRPILEALGSTVLHVGTEAEGSSLKLAVNAWLTASTVAISDVLSLCDSLGIDHAVFVDALEAGPLAMPYALAKITMMDARSFPPGFSVRLALKDVDLSLASASPTPLFRAVRDRLDETVAAGHGDEDIAAVDYRRGDGGD